MANILDTVILSCDLQSDESHAEGTNTSTHAGQSTVITHRIPTACNSGLTKNDANEQCKTSTNICNTKESEIKYSDDCKTTDQTTSKTKQGLSTQNMDKTPNRKYENITKETLETTDRERVTYANHVNGSNTLLTSSNPKTSMFYTKQTYPKPTESVNTNEKRDVNECKPGQITSQNCTSHMNRKLLENNDKSTNCSTCTSNVDHRTKCTNIGPLDISKNEAIASIQKTQMINMTNKSGKTLDVNGSLNVHTNASKHLPSVNSELGNPQLTRGTKEDLWCRTLQEKCIAKHTRTPVETREKT